VAQSFLSRHNDALAAYGGSSSKRGGRNGNVAVDRNAPKTGAGLETAAEVSGGQAQKVATTAPPHQYFFEDLRLQDCFIVFGLFVVLLAVLIGEQLDPMFAKFLADYSVFSAFIFTLLLTLIAWGGLDALRAHWEAENGGSFHRWQ
jgi:hypothetical protein